MDGGGSVVRLLQRRRAKKILIVDRTRFDVKKVKSRMNSKKRGEEKKEWAKCAQTSKGEKSQFCCMHSIYEGKEEEEDVK